MPGVAGHCLGGVVEDRQRAVGFLEDEGGHEVLELGAGGELLDDQVAQVLGVADGDVEDEVAGAGDVVEGDDAVRLTLRSALSRDDDDLAPETDRSGVAELPPQISRRRGDPL